MSSSSRASLIESLKQLQSVSESLEALTQRLVSDRGSSPAERTEVERLAAQQSQLVEGMLASAPEGPAMQQYRTATERFETDMAALDSAADNESIAQLQQRMSQNVEAWVGALAAVLRDVVARA